MDSGDIHIAMYHAAWVLHTTVLSCVDVSASQLKHHAEFPKGLGSGRTCRKRNVVCVCVKGCSLLLDRCML